MKKIKLFLVIMAGVFVCNKVNAQLTGIAINDDGSKADTSAILDVNVNSTIPKRGFLLPRITTAERDAIYHPAKGLMIYAINVDSLELNVGSALSPLWVALGPGTSNVGWYTMGNSGTNSGINFLGTTDNTSLSIRTNNTEQMVVDSLGHVYIGTRSNSYNPQLSVDYNNNPSNTVAYFRGSVDDYFQINLRNKSNGTNASTDYIATADNGTDSTYYIDLGINSSNYAPSTENFGGPNDGYLYTYARNLLIGTGKPSTDIYFLLGGGNSKTNTALRISAPSGNVILGTGEATNAPVGNVLRGPNGKGTNIIGGSLTVQGGSATGTATGGSVNINGGTSVSGTGGAVNINSNSSFATNINTGTSTSDVTIGGSSNNILLPKFTTVGGLIYTAANTGQLGGTTQLIWDNTNARLGIGTATPLDKLHVVGNIRMVDGNQGAGKVLVSDANGTASWGSAGSLTVTNALSLSGNTLTSTVNGVAATSNAVSGVSNNSSTNTLTTTVNGITGTGVNIINSNGLSLSGTNLTSTVNGIASSAVDISSAISLSAWNLTGNSGTTAGTNFIGTTDLKDFVTKTNNIERMRILSSGNVGIGTTSPGSALDVKGTLRLSGLTSGYVGLQPSAAAGSTTYTLPAADGTSGQQLTTNGAGLLSWTNQTGTTTNSLSSSVNTITSTVNGVVATTNLINAVSVNSSVNTLSATVNGITGTGVNIINSNGLSLSGSNLTSTINGVASSPIDISSAVTSNAWSLIGNSGITPGTNFIGTTDLKDFVTKTNGTERMRILSTGNIGIGTTSPGSALDVKGILRLSGSTSGYVGLQPAAAAGSTTYTLPTADGTSGQQLTTNGAGVLSWTNQTGTTTVSNTSSSNTLTTTVNGVTGTGVNIINSNALSLSGNTLTSTVNGVAATSNAVSGVSNTSSTNTLTTTINGITGTGVNIINSNALSLSGNNLTSTVNGIASSPIDISSAVTSNAWSLIGNSGTTPGTNFIGTTDLKDFIAKTNGTERMRILSTGSIGIGTTSPGSALDVKGALRLSGSTSGYVGLQPAAAAGSTTYTLPAADGTSGQQLTTNGAGVLSWTNQTGTTTVSNTSSSNTLTTTVNGVTGTGVNIINSNALSLSGTNITSTVNGVASTALDVSSAITSTAWSLTGNSGTTAGTNFVGTTDAIDFVTKTNNTERMRVTSAGNVGIGLSNPSYKLQVFAASNPLYLTGVQVGTASTDSILTISSGIVKKIAPLGNIVGLFKNQYSVTLPAISNNSGTTVTVPVSNAPYVAGGPNPVVQVNPSVDLPDGLIIAWTRVSATNTVSICFRNVTNQATTSQTIKFDISVIQ